MLRAGPRWVILFHCCGGAFLVDPVFEVVVAEKSVLFGDSRFSAYGACVCD